MSLSTAESLRVVAEACKAVVENVTDPDRQQPYVLNKITAGGLPSFQFVTTVYVGGVPVEVQVKPQLGSREPV
jgi:hypothetical protein